MDTGAVESKQIKVGKSEKIIKLIRQFLIKENFIIKENDEILQLVNDIHDARKDWMNACVNYEFADDEVLIDYYIYNIKACQIKYEHLLRLAKQQGIKVDTLENTSPAAVYCRSLN